VRNTSNGHHRLTPHLEDAGLVHVCILRLQHLFGCSSRECVCVCVPLVVCVHCTVHSAQGPSCDVRDAPAATSSHGLQRKIWFPCVISCQTTAASWTAAAAASAIMTPVFRVGRGNMLTVFSLHNALHYKAQVLWAPTAFQVVWHGCWWPPCLWQITLWHTTPDACVFDLLVRPVLSGVLLDG
jgi:hypothetical protein